MTPDPPPWVLEDPLVNIIHFEHGSVVGGVNSAKKSANIWPFNVYLASKVMSNSECFIDHLVILPAKSGQKNTFLSGWSVGTIMEWARKYLLGFLVANECQLLDFLERVSGPAKAFEQN